MNIDPLLHIREVFYNFVEVALGMIIRKFIPDSL